MVQGVNQELFAAADSVARLARIIERAAAPLSLADFRVLSAIEQGEDRASRLAQRLAVGKPAISATVESLAKRGLVERAKVEGDQRATALAITPQGALEFGDAKQRLAQRVSAVADATGDAAATISTLAQLGPAIEALRAQQEAAVNA
jgi:DNA-binding MarR family transcriptional regulator